MLKVALLSDIHANLPALEAVLADLDALEPDAVFVLGDLINGCPWPAEVLERLFERGWPMLMGNHDDAVLQLGTPRMEPRYAFRQRYGTLWWTRERLSEPSALALERLPLELSPAWDGLPAIRLAHGIPGNFFAGLRPNVPAGWAIEQLAEVPEPVFAGGHTHDPMIRHIGRWLVINTGSVGIPYDGDPRASYAWLWSHNGQWQAGIRRVAYDLDRVDRAFAASGLLADAGVSAELIRRSVLTAQPWVSDFFWWVREQPAELLEDMPAALARYDATHGPGRWAFPFV